MSKSIVYDKVSWHFPEGKHCPSLEAAKTHFYILIGWIKENGLLSDEGEEILDLEVGADFSITSSMLNKKGNDILSKYYANWLSDIDYLGCVDMKILDGGLSEYEGSNTHKPNR